TNMDVRRTIIFATVHASLRLSAHIRKRENHACCAGRASRPAAMPSIRYNRLVRYVLPSLLCCLGAMGSVVAQAHPPEANPRTSGAQENERRIAATTEVAKLAIDEELPLSAELESAVRHVRGASNA